MIRKQKRGAIVITALPLSQLTRFLMVGDSEAAEGAQEGGSEAVEGYQVLLGNERERLGAQEELLAQELSLVLNTVVHNLH